MTARNATIGPPQLIGLLRFSESPGTTVGLSGIVLDWAGFMAPERFGELCDAHGTNLDQQLLFGCCLSFTV